MKLENIIEQHAKYAPQVSITLARGRKAVVLIADTSGSGQPAIRLTGREGEDFADQMDCLASSAPALAHDVACRFLARPYTERLWR